MLLAEFQNHCAAAMLHHKQLPDAAHTINWSVHRNTVIASLMDVLATQYPTVTTLVGIEWFNAVAHEYVQQHLPVEPVLALYGEQFAAFLAAFEPAATWPYLAEVARLDRLWTECYFAADAPPLTTTTVAALTPTQLESLQLSPHPALRFTWCQHTAVTVWQHHRPPAPPPTTLSLTGLDEGIVMTRPHDTVNSLLLTAIEYSFLNALSTGVPVGVAATSVLTNTVDVENNAATTLLAESLTRLITAGAFTVKL